MPKKPKSLKTPSLRNPIGIPIVPQKQNPLRESLKEPIGEEYNHDLSPEQNAMFDMLIGKAAKWDRENGLTPELSNQEKLMADLKKYEDAYKELQDNKTKTTEEKNRPLLKALDALHYYFKRENQQSPVWLFNAIEENLSKTGRRATFTRDIKETASHFIRLLILFGSSKTQAVNLFGVMRGNIVVTENFKLEMMNAYKDFFEKDDIGALSYAEIADIISFTREITSTARINKTEESVSKALAALKIACNKLLTFIKDNIEAIQKIDLDYEDRYALVLPLFHASGTDAISSFFRPSLENEDYDDFGYQLRMFVHAVESHK